MSILNYFLIGVIFTFILDSILQSLKNHPKLKKVVKDWGWNERIACILVWPLGFVAFFGSLILSFFKK